MASPKFQFAIQELQKCINEKRLISLWKDKIGGQLRKQVYLDLVEYRDYSDRIPIIAEQLCAEIREGRYRPNPGQVYLVEKSRGLCRQMTLLQPRDLLVLQALSSYLYADLKKHQPTTKAYFEPGDHKFNSGSLFYRGNEYGSIASWKRFQKTIFEFSKEHPWLVVTDIANFYDFINFRHLRNIVSSYCEASECILDLLLFILNEVTWVPDFMPRIETGLPQIEIEAPRVLANAMLYELDRVAEKYSNGDYARFMDDIDVGADSLQEAKRIVRDIDLTLQTRQLRLNSSKTKILNSSTGETEEHFCIKENKFLDSLSSLIEVRKGPSTPIVKALQKSYIKWRGAPLHEPIHNQSRFFRGNGAKVFKRVVILSAHLRICLPMEDLLHVIWKDPSLRQYAFNALTRIVFPNDAFYRLKVFFEKGDFVDDQAVVHMAMFMLHAQFRKTRKFDRLVLEFIDWCIAQKSVMYTYAGFLVSSKFAQPKKILEIVKLTEKQWTNNHLLGRCIGGMFPRISTETAILPEFMTLIESGENTEAIAVLDFHYKLQTDPKALGRISQYLRSTNPSFAHGIIHPKVLVLLSAKQNAGSAPLLKEAKKIHPIIQSDAYLKHWFT